MIMPLPEASDASGDSGLATATQRMYVPHARVHASVCVRALRTRSVRMRAHSSLRRDAGLAAATQRSKALLGDFDALPLLR